MREVLDVIGDAPQCWWERDTLLDVLQAIPDGLAAVLHFKPFRRPVLQAAVDARASSK